VLARQPIFDRDGASATSAVLINAFTHLNMNDLVGNHHVYVNFTRTALHHPVEQRHPYNVTRTTPGLIVGRPALPGKPSQQSSDPATHLRYTARQFY
jgi:hypothetical protein